MSDIGQAERSDLLRLGAVLVLDDAGSDAVDLHPEEAVDLAARLVASGASGAALLELAALPQERKSLRSDDVITLVRQMFRELGIALPSASEAAWWIARARAEAIVRGEESPGPAASGLWALWDDCGRAGELAWMLQLNEAWYLAFGDPRRRSEIEDEIVAYAPAVIDAANRQPGRATDWTKPI